MWLAYVVFTLNSKTFVTLNYVFWKQYHVVLILYNVPLPYIRYVECMNAGVTWSVVILQVLISDMASFKPTKVQFLPKLGETVTEDTLYWKNYKVWDVLDTYCNVYVQRKVYVGLSVFWFLIISYKFSVFIYTDSLCFVFQSPVQIKEFGAITKIDFSPLPPHNYAVTASTRVSPFNFLSYLYIHLLIFAFIQRDV